MILSRNNGSAHSQHFPYQSSRCHLTPPVCAVSLRPEFYDDPESQLFFSTGNQHDYASCMLAILPSCESAATAGIRFLNLKADW